MNRLDRLFAILIHLQSKKYVPAEQLSARFEISVRTVYRDIKALIASGIPVSHEPFRGYFIVQGFFLSPVAFNPGEANALLLMEKLVSGFADKATQTHYTSAMAKIKSVLQSAEKEKLETLSSSMGLQVPEMLILNNSFIPSIQNAIIQKRLLEIEYKNKKEETSRRKVEAIGLVFYAFGWHLIGWCHTREDYRDFKLNRILALKDLDQPFLKTDHMALTTYMTQLPVKF
ncbi:MAG TPA: YafY family protein [Arachidicoccus sp.]|nr:YafY family protein [Arachidicoccus sp.]